MILRKSSISMLVIQIVIQISNSYRVKCNAHFSLDAKSKRKERCQIILDDMKEAFLDGCSTIVLCALFSIFFILILHLFRYLVKEPHIHIRDVTKEHNWKAIKRETKYHS
ncbi:hypothetical protein E2986_12619 [Frieseomelitta varia]|uniref:Uncharacterized protein n=1 Tax=Frieseomelitta varia TaxID=561572 RepID=A0A833SJJ1_9HYME|nr:hypothetical protein E2986_12619 [Frieseomelitta varia]